MFMTVVLCPILGSISDKIGYKSLFLIVSPCFYLISFALFLIFPICGGTANCDYSFIIPLTLNGIGLAIYFAIIFAIIPILV